MFQAPEVKHLRRAVDAVKRSLLPQKQREPEEESDEDYEKESSEEVPER